MNERARAYLMLLLVYGVAVAVGAGVYVALSGVSELWRAAAADAAATLAVFAFSVGVRNSSMYDPYWSAAPPALFLLWSMTHEVSPRALMVGGLATVWGARLTWNFLRGFPHLSLIHI